MHLYLNFKTSGSLHKTHTHTT